MHFTKLEYFWKSNLNPVEMTGHFYKRQHPFLVKSGPNLTRMRDYFKKIQNAEPSPSASCRQSVKADLAGPHSTVCEILANVPTNNARLSAFQKENEDHLMTTFGIEFILFLLMIFI